MLCSLIASLHVRWFFYFFHPEFPHLFSQSLYCIVELDLLRVCKQSLFKCPEVEGLKVIQHGIKVDPYPAHHWYNRHLGLYRYSHMLSLLTRYKEFAPGPLLEHHSFTLLNPDSETYSPSSSSEHSSMSFIHLTSTWKSSLKLKGVPSLAIVIPSPFFLFLLNVYTCPFFSRYSRASGTLKKIGLACL